MTRPLRALSLQPAAQLDAEGDVTTTQYTDPAARCEKSSVFTKSSETLDLMEARTFEEGGGVRLKVSAVPTVYIPRDVQLPNRVC